MLKIVPNQENLMSVGIVESGASNGMHDGTTTVIQLESVPDFHTEFRLQNDVVVFIDLGSDFGTALNGEKVSSPVKGMHDALVKGNDTELIKLVGSDYEPRAQKSKKQATNKQTPKKKVAKKQTPRKQEADNDATKIRSVVSGWMLIGKPEALMPGEFPIEDAMIVGRDKECDLSISVSHISRQHAQFEIIDSALKVKDLGSTNGTSVNGENIIETELQNGDVICFDEVEFFILGPVKKIPRNLGKTQVREVVAEVEVAKDEVIKEEDKKKVSADAYKVISEGSTAVGDVWKEGSAKADINKAENKTVIMSPVDVASDHTRGMPIVDQELKATLECVTKPLLGVKFDLQKKISSVGRTDENDVEINESSVSSKHAQMVHENGSWFIQDLGSYNGTFVNNKKCEAKSIKLKNGDVIGLGRMQLLFSNEAASGVFERIKRLSSGIKVPILLVKTIALLVVVSIISEFMYSYITKLEFGDDVELNLDWENISSVRINPSRPVLFDMNNDGVDDVIITSENGMVEVIDGGNGFKLSSIASGISLYSSPLLIDVGSDNKMDIVNVSSNGDVIAFDINGSRLWTNTDMHGQLLVSQAVAVNINQDNVKDIILPTEKNGVVILDGETGNQLVQLTAFNGKSISRPIVQDINRDSAIDVVTVTDTNHIAAFSIQDLKVRKLWEVTTPPILSAPLKYGQIKSHGVIFVATQNDGVLALNSYTGNKIWHFKIDDLLLAEPVLVDTDGDRVNDAVIQATFSGNVIALDTESGDQIWKITLPNKLQAEPVVLQNTTNAIGELIFVDTEGEMHTVSIESGDISNSKKIEKADRFVVSPLLRNRTLNTTSALIFTSQNGNVFVYRVGESDK